VSGSTANIFVLVDGLGWEWIKASPFLADVAPYRRPLDTVLGFSVGAIASILTGLYPQEHGRMTMFHRAVDGGSPFAWLRWLCAMPPELVENRYVRRAVSAAVAAMGRLNGYFNLYRVPLRDLPLLDVAEKRDIYRPGGIPGSHSIFDLLAGSGRSWRSYSYRQGPDFSLIERAQRELSSDSVEFCFLYLSGIDAFLHAHANDELLVSEKLEEYSIRLTNLYRAVRQTRSRVRMFVFSDHGMAPTRSSVDVVAALAATAPVAGRDYLCLLESSMARFWFFDKAARDPIERALRDGEAGRWMDEEELRSLRAWFPDQRYGEAIYLMAEGNVIAPSHMALSAPNGMHGFHPRAPHSKAMLMGSEDYGAEAGSITDVFNLMRSCC
jgi:predicted transcriptional regulator